MNNDLPLYEVQELTLEDLKRLMQSEQPQEDVRQGMDTETADWPSRLTA